MRQRAFLSGLDLGGMQEAAVGEAAAAAQTLVLRAEALRRAVVDVGAHYRLLFAWMLTLCRRVNEDALPPGASPVAFQADPHALAAFLRGPFRRDAVGPQLSCEVLPSPFSHRAHLAAPGGRSEAFELF